MYNFRENGQTYAASQNEAKLLACFNSASILRDDLFSPHSALARSMPHFVLLRHICPPEFKPSHWDFMLESNGVLLTWELQQMPGKWCDALQLSTGSAPMVVCRRIADHRLDYLGIEGPISGNRGSVTQIDAGACEYIAQSESRIVVELSGRTLSGRVELAELEHSESWTLSTQD